MLLNNNENNITKPKRPFLKRGSGLVRFKMNPGDQKRPFNKVLGMKNQRKNSISKSSLCSNSIAAPQNIEFEVTPLKRPDVNSIAAPQNIEFEVTPLKRPDVNVKAVWFKIEDNNSVINNSSAIKDTEMLAKKTISQINELAAQNLPIPSKSAQIQLKCLQKKLYRRLTNLQLKTYQFQANQLRYTSI
ncbi:hypothetical protein QE152_g3577 [Popillia japonica]|uniref:CENPJ tubulin-binding region domain-containing protein n=1 Tax=Popillia japonica TaxID=7064 RepID=A0AAW1N3A6_POPJA